MSADKPSIAELMRMEQQMDRAPWYSAESRWQSDCVLTGAPDADITNDGRVVAQANPNFDYRANLDGIAALRNAAPVLLEIAAAGKAWAAQRAENLHAALMRTEAEIEAEAQDVQRARVKRTADLAAALEKALAKVNL